MATKTTKIEWTDKTWNPVTGCTKISQGCAHCYAEVMSRRLKAMGLEKYANGFQVTLHDECLDESGPQVRLMKEEWVLNIKRQTETQGAAFFFKQWGTWGADGVKRNKDKNGKMIEGKVFQVMPV